MGLLCDLFVSTPEEALKYADPIGTLSPTTDPSGEWTGLRSHEFGLLWAILEGRPYEPKRHDLVPVKVDDERWLYRFPDDFVALLLPLRGKEIDRAATAWADLEALNWEPSGAVELIEDLLRLATIANAKGMGLYFWGSL